MKRLPRPRGYLLSIALFTCAMIVFTGFANAQPAYVVVNLGTLPGDNGSVAMGINALGQVVGWSGTSPSRAFLYTDGIGMVELPGLPGQTYTLARGINDAGVVAGEGWGGGTAGAIRWTNGTPEFLGVLKWSASTWDINAAGQVVGESPEGSLDSHAFLFTDEAGMTDLIPEWYFSHAFDINDAGQIAGHSGQAFRWTPGIGIELLGALSGFPLVASRAINISGQVGGVMSSATGFSSNLFRYTDGIGIIDLGPISSGTSNEALVGGMNARGDMVGVGIPESGGLTRAFIYTDETGDRDLRSLIEDPVERVRWFLSHAWDINDAGQIAAIGYDNDTGGWRAVRLDPTTPVGPLAEVALTPVTAEGGTTPYGWATLTLPAPPGGASVTLSTDNPAVAAVPPNIVIPDGQRHGQFSVTTYHVDATTNVAINAEYDGTARSAILEVTPPTATGIGERRELTPALWVRSVFPTPTNRSTAIHYELSRAAHVVLRVFSVDGRTVRTLVDSRQGPGVHVAVWDGRDNAGGELPSGVYFFETRAAHVTRSGRIVLVR